jgi:hypothetical protein
MCVAVLPVCMYVCIYCATYVPATRGQKRPSGLLELELQMVVNHHVGAGIWTQVLCESRHCSNHCAISPDSLFSILFFFFFFFFLVLVFRDRVSLCSRGCPGTHSVDQAGLELRNPPASASWMLGLKACTTTAWPYFQFFFFFLKIYLFINYM